MRFDNKIYDSFVIKKYLILIKNFIFNMKSTIDVQNNTTKGAKIFSYIQGVYENM